MCSSSNSVLLVISCVLVPPSSSGSVGLRQSPFGNSTGPVFLGGVRCTGHERSLLACQHTLRPQSCGNSLSVGVRCQPGPGRALVNIYCIIDMSMYSQKSVQS